MNESENTPLSWQERIILKEKFVEQQRWAVDPYLMMTADLVYEARFGHRAEEFYTIGKFEEMRTFMRTAFQFGPVRDERGGEVPSPPLQADSQLVGLIELAAQGRGISLLRQMEDQEPMPKGPEELLQEMLASVEALGPEVSDPDIVES